MRPAGPKLLRQCFEIAFGEAVSDFETLSAHRPAVFKDAFDFCFYLDCPLPGEGPDCHAPLKIDSFGPVPVRIRGIVLF